MDEIQRKMLASLQAKEADTLTEDEKSILKDLEAKEKAEKEAAQGGDVTLGDLTKAVKESMGEATKTMVKEILDPIAKMVKDGVAPAAVQETGDKRRSFREMLKGIKKEDGYLLKKYDMAGDTPEAKALSEGTDAAGGFLVPTEESNKLINLIKEKSYIRQVAQIWPMRSNVLQVPIVTSGVTAYWIDESALKTPSDPVFGQMTLTAYKLCVITIVSDELLEDSDPAVDAVLFDLFAKAIMRGEETAFMQGTGGAGDPIVGIYNTPAINTVVSGASLNLDEVSQLFNAVEQNEGEDLKVFHSLRELSALRTMKDDNGQYIYQQPADKNVPRSIWGYDTFANKYIPINLGGPANQSYMVAGDFNHAHIGDRKGIVIKANSGGVDWFKYDLTAFRAVKRVAFGVDDATKFARLTAIRP